MARHAGNANREGAEDLSERAFHASAQLTAYAADRKKTSSGANGAPSAPEQQNPRTSGELARRNGLYIASAAVIVLVVALGMIALRAFLPDSSTTAETVAEEARYVSPYDWTKLDRTGGRYRYVVDGQVRSRLGVDVSENQHEIDWGSVAADGIDFAIVRIGYRGATEGNLYLDERFRDNIDGARAAGIDCGAYFFSQARTADEAVEEADYVLAHLNGTPLEYPIAFDSEEVALGVEASRTAGLTNNEMTAVAEAFCTRIEAAGYRSMVYGNAADLARYRYASLERQPIWWAEYGTSTPAANIDIALWQYSNDGRVSGISTAVDMNIDLSRALG